MSFLELSEAKNDEPNEKSFFFALFCEFNMGAMPALEVPAAAAAAAPKTAIVPVACVLSLLFLLSNEEHSSSSR